MVTNISYEIKIIHINNSRENLSSKKVTFNQDVLLVLYYNKKNHVRFKKDVGIILHNDSKYELVIKRLKKIINFIKKE
jgi:hypothetical protein